MTTVDTLQEPTIEIQAATKATPIKPTNQHLLHEVNVVLVQLRKDGEYPDAKMAGEIDVSASYLSQWRSNVFRGNIVKIEKRISQWVDVKRQRLSLPKMRFQNVECAIYNQTVAFLKRTQITNCITVLAGPAGLGKTTAAKTLCAEDELTLFGTVTRANRSNAGIQRMLSRQMGLPGPKLHQTPFDVLVEALMEHPRLIILDQAHRLSHSGREFIFDLHDATGNGLGLIGNESIIDDIEGRDRSEMLHNQQFASRVALKPVYSKPYDEKFRLVGNPGADTEGAFWFSPSEIKQVLARYPIEYSSALFEKCKESAEKPGHLRRLHFRLVHTMEFMKKFEELDAWEEAEALCYDMEIGNAESKGDW